MPSGNPSASSRRDCPDCGAGVPPAANFCLQCGTELEESALPTYCPSCGEQFDRADEFCSNCGTARTDVGRESTRSSRPPPNADSASNLESASSPRSDSNPQARREFRRRVQQHLDAGWELQHDYGDRVVLVDRDIGSIPVHIVLLFLTSGVGNLLYGWYHYSKLAEQRQFAIDDRHAPPVDEPERDSTTAADEGLSTIAAYVITATFLFVGAVLFLAAVANGTIGAGLIGLVFTAVGLSVAPGFRRRLERRHGITDFGRKRTVDHRAVGPDEAADERCVVCNRSFDGGLVRRRRDETVVAGIPVRTHAMEYNHYCADCAKTDPLGPGADAGSRSHSVPGPDAARDLERDDCGPQSTSEPANADVNATTDDRE